MSISLFRKYLTKRYKFDGSYECRKIAGELVKIKSKRNEYKIKS